MNSKDFGRIFEKSMISTFLTFIIFVKTLALPAHNVLLLFCSSKTEGKLKNIEKAVLNFSLGRS